MVVDHICPYGIEAKRMLEEAECATDEDILHSREVVDAFAEKQGVNTAPQGFIGDKRASYKRQQSRK